MGSTSVSWEVSSFEVQATTPNATSDALYANGNMQVPVIVVISVVDPDTNNAYELNESELEAIELIDYDDPPTEISGSWSYSITENEFEHGLPSTQKTVQPDLFLAAGGPQKKRYWVTTTKVEDKRIGANIKQPDVTYKVDDLNFEQQEDNVEQDFPDKSGTWVQRNFYLTTKKYELRKADLQGYDLGTVDPSLEYATAYLDTGIGFFSIFYYWPMGSEETRTVGIDSHTAEVTINQKSNALCVTHMFLSAGTTWPASRTWESRFTFYDKFGNPGTFWLGYDDTHVTPEILEHIYTLEE
ncbi:hypothetical protein AtubIFM55763_008237 [Aspergillus tubingensis]|uniref:calcineurin-like phosphoesterase n=1 Tax=Aspergillus tubingensis TaxID=5068 RepID=UPI001579AE06|nr:calcineurin-like phosphoesterase [Aspergillus tubingensis]GFN11305.1 calcineurin-like phosphoesterase [Aspergillus tubingensis]GLA69056.1 hypothetical protein AtubIFM55763_008237 [Aspergillus tubingensis]GLB21558.1 hypothetical protein AtubIFM61612_002106 [Aspergillus tubingensis]